MKDKTKDKTQVNWIKVFWESRKGWTDHLWGCRANWLWSVERVLPNPFKTRSSSSTKLLWALIGNYYEKHNIHFVSPTGCCMTCKKRFEPYDATKSKGRQLLNCFVIKIINKNK